MVVKANNGGEHSGYQLPTVAVVGRPNVGKSALFNAIIGRRLSIVHEECGVTRDRIMAPVAWHGRHCQLIDTGGLGTFAGEKKNLNLWDEVIRLQVEAAIEDAAVLIFVVDVMSGITNLDREVALRLHGTGKKVFMAVNKADNPALANQADEFAELGFENIFAVSSLHRFGLENLMGAVLSDCPVYKDMPEQTAKFPIAVVGRPNVGKSSLVNCLLGETRVLVSDVAGTTRDSVDIDFSLEYHGENMSAVLIDTAGLRKKAKVDSPVEYFSVIRAKEAIRRSRLVLFMVEAGAEGVTAQDRRIAGHIAATGKACVIVVNKADRFPESRYPELLKELRWTLPGTEYAPAVFVSALQRYNIGQLLDQIAEVIEQLDIHISTAMVNRVIEDAMARNTPPVIGRSPFKIYYGTMTKNDPPTFTFFVNDPKLCAGNYLAYLNHAIRRAFDFTGLPIVIKFRSRPKTIESIHSFERKSRKYQKKVKKT